MTFDGILVLSWVPAFETFSTQDHSGCRVVCVVSYVSQYWISLDALSTR
jgi:hypothetical protein